MFSDDWGRHPSSCQHLIRHLLPRYPVLWVNTIGMRAPSLSLGDLAKVLGKLKAWTRPAAKGPGLPENLRVLSPRMYPGFRSPWQRRLNARLIASAVNAALGPRRPGERRVAITTLPITADLLRADAGPAHTLDVDRWVYYCVDDFAVWPGLDSEVMRRMEAQQLGRLQHCVGASEHLVDRLRSMGAQPELLTHGIDLDHWRHPHARPGVAGALDGLARPVFLFWGLLDARLDLDLCKALLARGGDGPAARGWLALVGPQQSPPAGLASLGRCLTPGPADYADLPAWAARADALVMPYADLPVTRAMQPLKFKEYLATGKPVIARRLPATEAWADACDLHDDADTFARAAWSRAEQGTPPEQLAARGRLADEAWARKAQLLERNWIDLAPPAAP